MTATILLLLSGFVYVVSLQHTHSHFFTRLRVRASLASHSHFEPDNMSSSFVREVRQRHLQRLPDEKEYFFENDSSLIQCIETELPGLPLFFINDIKRFGASQHHDGFRHYSGLTHDTGKAKYIVIAYAYDESGENQMNFLRNLLLLGFSASCLFVFVLGRLFAYRIMKPISSIIANVNDITVTNLHARVEAGNGDDELTEIAAVFNTMLDRLETAFELQSNFISNASHEFRTPLTAILGEAEIILQAPRDAEDYKASIKAIQHEARKLEDLTSSLLRLSQISYDGKKQKIEPVLLDELLMSIKIHLDRQRPDNHVKVMIGQADNPDIYTLVCARAWMELALLNIINNSIKYSDNKEVLVTLSANQHDIFIHISDSGIGIPDEEIKHIFEPFFRASNTLQYTGYGIGLPLAAKIIRLHGGVININSRAGQGTKVSLQFPQT